MTPSHTLDPSTRPPPYVPHEWNGNEFALPEWSNIILLGDNFLPIAVFFTLFYFLAVYVKTNMWMQAKGFRQYRLRNLSVCLVHSVITSLWVLKFTLQHPDAMFVYPMHWYTADMRFLLLFSTAYFFYDLQDMLRHEISRYTVELSIHHFICVFAFATSLSSKKFVPFAYCSLLMEINSTFLHTRTIMTLTRLSETRKMLYNGIRALNILSFVVFRFGVQLWQTYFVFVNAVNIHHFYYIFGVYGGVIFLSINSCLFFRILSADGLLGDFGKKHAAIGRDD